MNLLYAENVFQDKNKVIVCRFKTLLISGTISLLGQHWKTKIKQHKLTQTDRNMPGISSSVGDVDLL